ncbi:protein ARK2N isoform X2 [Ascaphus truei]|uniref:protein ARK2N isoform X2 n=1 Tax=Ascaphus truei TaxID=8439 RepID=UPI003F5AA434
MKMEAVGKSEELLDSEVPPQITQQKVDTQAEDGSLEIEASSPKDGAQDVPDSSGLSSMPCLLMELRRDSSESQLASTESDKPTAGRVYESDSSNHCMLSPSSSGHLADSDTMSSADENETLNPEAITEGGDPAIQGAAVGRKSRRSRSESETSTMAAKKNRQSSDKQNGRVAKIKGHRSQKHKERIRLLRQKREAAARKKYNLLQDSSTSDSDLTCYSSSSSSDEDEEVSGSSKTITAEIPAGFCRAGGSAGATRDIPGLLDRGTVWDRNCIGNVLEEAMNCFAEMQRQTEEKFRMWIEKLTRLDTDEESKQLEPREPKLQLVGQRISPSSPSSPFMAVPESPVLPHQSYTSYQNVDTTEFPASLNNNFPATFPENDGPPVVTHYDISDTNSDPEVLNVDNLLAAAVVKEHSNSLTNQDALASWRTRGLLEELNADSVHLDPGLPVCDKKPPSGAQTNAEISIASSDSEVEIVGVQEHARFVHPRGGVIQSVSSWKHAASSQYLSSHQTPSWTAVPPQQNWTSPAEVVDLTLDEDTRRKYLL